MSKVHVKRVYTPEQIAHRRETQRIRRAALSIEERRRRRNRDNKRGKLSRYRMTEAQYTEMWASQGCRCAICRTAEKPHKKDWHIDHCHDTNRVRGILCARCNMLLGHAKDNPVILEAAIRYLHV